jgi:hypothetical protein
MSYKKIRNADTVRYTSGGSTGAIATTVEDQLVRVLHVRDFGALGDGATNDTVAIQNALDALVSGDILEFGAGRYVVEATLTVTVGGVTIRGRNATQNGGNNQGPTAHIILAVNGITAFELNTFQGTGTYVTPSATGTASTFTSPTLEPTEIVFDGLAIHNRMGAEANTLIGIDGTGMINSAITVMNCHFSRIDIGILGAVSGQSLVVRDNYFLAVQTASISTCAIDTLIANNHFGGSGPIVTPTGTTSQRLSVIGNIWNGGPPTNLYIDSSAGLSLDAFIFSNNHIFAGAADPVFLLTNVADFVISGNSINVSGSVQFTIDSTSDAGTITGNTITSGSATIPIFSIDGDNILVASNTLVTIDGDPIIDILSGANNTRVLGNSFLTVAGAVVEIGTAVTDGGTNSIISSGAPLDEQIDVVIYTELYAPDAQRNFPIRLNAKYPVTVVNMTHRLDSGTTSATLEIDGVAIGGLEDIAISSAEGTEGATGANSLFAGNELSVQLTGESSPETLALSIKTVRILPSGGG